MFKILFMKFFLGFLFFIVATASAQTSSSAFKQVNLVAVPRPQKPANLVISDIQFTDSKEGNNNASLDAAEKAEINFSIENKGEGTAYSVKLLISDSSNIKGVRFDKLISIGVIEPGAIKSVVVPINASMELITGTANLNMQVKEGNNFDADPFAVLFKTNEFKKPELVIEDAVFLSKSSVDDAQISVGSLIQLSILVHNKGEGHANNVQVEFVTPSFVFPVDKFKFDIEDLGPDETKRIDYEFIPNKQYLASNVNIKIKVTEKSGKYGIIENKSTPIQIKQGEKIVVNTQSISAPKAAYKQVSLMSEVDKNIPVNSKKYNNRYAIIFGNEDYSSFQSDLSKEVNVDFAINDAKVFKEYCEKTLGIPTLNIRYVANATYGKMKQNIDWINKLMKNSYGELEVFFYYAGHGLPDEVTKEAYLIPVDVSGSNLQSAIKLQDVYKSLTEFESVGVTAFIDACFSGGARNQEMVKARGVKVVPRGDYIEGGIVAFSASSGNQSSNAYYDQKHGMFTYHLLKSLQESKGDINYKSFWESLKRSVSFESIKVNSKEQDPQIMVGKILEKKWEDLKFIY
jgi:hypothetical protein